jgi:hypothetical protein
MAGHPAKPFQAKSLPLRAIHRMTRFVIPSSYRPSRSPVAGRACLFLRPQRRPAAALGSLTDEWQELAVFWRMQAKTTESNVINDRDPSSS